MLKFGPDADAVVSTIDSPFVTLRNCLGESGSIVRVRVRRQGATKETVIKPERAHKITAKLFDLPGEAYNCGSGWVATYETAKRLGYATIYVSIESPA